MITDQLSIITTGSSAAMELPSYLKMCRRDIDAKLVVLLTTASLRFVNPAALRLIADEVIEPSAPEFNPVKLAHESRLLVVCPATANFLVSASLGLANSPALTAFLAAPVTKMLFPQMNPVMWRARTTQRAVGALREEGCIVVNPESAQVFTAWNKTIGDGEAIPSPGRTVEIVSTQWEKSARE